MEYCDFPAGRYRAFITSSYIDYDKSTNHIDSNIFYFESTQPVEDIAILSSDIAIAHPRFGKSEGGNTIWICYILEEDNVLRIKFCEDAAPYKKWQTFHIPRIIADKCSICFDARIESIGSISEFVTDTTPWVCYTFEGALYILDLNTGVSTLVVTENVTDLDMIRGPITRNNSRDYGLIIFFLMENQIYYKQRINNIWYDAEVVSLNVNNALFNNLVAFRTWDYRTGVQVSDMAGELYQFITYPEGLFDMREHISFRNVQTDAGLTWAWSAVPVNVINVEDTNNWGTTIQVTFDWPNTAQNLLPSMFTLVDSNGYNYVCHSCSVDGTILTLGFDDFNLTYYADYLTLTYTKPVSGGLISPAVQTNSFVEIFEPINLEPPAVDPPTFSSATNDSIGMEITVVFTEDLLDSDITLLASHFNILAQEYNYVPEGSLQPTTRTVASIIKTDSKTLVLTINKPSLTSAIGNVSIVYDGLGGLKGLGGPAPAFTGAFTITGTTWKGNQNNVEHIQFNNVTTTLTMYELRTLNVKTADEHIQFSNATTTLNLIALQYLDTKTSDEHIQFNNVTTTVVLTDVHDI